jgi:hypothetical protein
VVVVTFVVTLLFPLISLPGNYELGDFIDEAIIFTVVVAIISVAIYFAYDYILHRTMGHLADEPKTSSDEGASD